MSNRKTAIQHGDESNLVRALRFITECGDGLPTALDMVRFMRSAAREALAYYETKQRSKPEPQDESDLLAALRRLLGAYEVLASSDPDMPSHAETEREAEAAEAAARAVIAKHTAKQPRKPDLTCVVIDLRGALNARDNGDDSATEDYLYDALKALGASRWESEEAAWEHGRLSFDNGIAEEAVQTHDADPLRESWVHGWRDRQREDAEDRSTPADV